MTEALAHEGTGPALSGSPRPVFSVCIVSAHRRELLVRCLDSLRRQEGAPRFELLVGADDDPSVEEVVHARFADADVIHLSHPTPAGLRNSLLGRARGEWLLFLDDDLELEPHLLRTIAELAAAHPDAGVLGGPTLAPPGSSRFQVVQAAVLASLLATGPVRRRYGAHAANPGDEASFTLCALAVRREVMVEFDERLVCAEENELLEGLRRDGVSMRYEPSLLTYHERRPTWKGFAGQMHWYGRGRGQLIARRPSATRPAHLAPVALLAYLAIAVPLAVVGPPELLLPLLVYGAVLAAAGVRVGLSLRRPGAVPVAAALTLVVHLSYGSGVIRGYLTESAKALAGLAAVPIRHRALLHTLIGRQLRLRMKRSTFGLVWPLVAPLFLYGLYLFVFNGIFDVPVDRYPEYLLIGLLPWAFLVQTLSTSISSISFEPELIRRARFPYELLPVASLLTMSLYFLASLTALLGYLAVTGQLTYSLLPLLILPIASLYLFVGAVSLVLALIDVYNRDLRQVLANLLTVWFFLVPIVYRQQDLGSELRFLQSVDPANLIVGQFRRILYDGFIPHPEQLFELLAICLVTWLFALALFRRFAPRLPKEV